MPKILVITITEDYPFSFIRPNQDLHNGPVLIRKVIQTTQANHNITISKATFLKNLRNKHLIKVQKLVFESHQVGIFYQSVQSKFKWKDQQNIVQVHNQLKNLTTYLANIGVKAYLKPNRIGINQNKIVKYYLGLDFQWDTEKGEQFLPNFYSTELTKLFGNEFTLKININNSNQTHHNFHQRNSPSFRDRENKYATNPQRKVSFATLPSRQSRMQKIEKQVNYLRSAVHRKQQPVKMGVKSLSQNQNVQNNHREERFFRQQLLRDKDKLAKKLQDRKFSGDVLKYNAMSGKKLYEHQSDIRSERDAYAPKNKLTQKLMQSNKQQIQTVHSKSRIQQMKYQQYLQIKKLQKCYLPDFIYVLEDQKDQFVINSARQLQSRETRPTQTSIKAEDTICLTAEALRMKAKEAILNSRKVIKKVKQLPTKAH